MVALDRTATYERSMSQIWNRCGLQIPVYRLEILLVSVHGLY